MIIPRPITACVVVSTNPAKMSSRTFTLSDSLYEYLARVSLREPEILKRLRQETRQVRLSGMQVSPEQGQFMALLVRLMGAKKCLEVGVYTGYSSLVVALVLPPEGKLIACDVSEEWTSIARRYWNEAGVADKIKLKLAPAAETLAKLMAAGEGGTFDFVFIDADKSGYAAYYEYALQLLRPGGLIAVDNVLWNGKVADLSAQDVDTVALRAFNDKLAHDQRVHLSMLPIGDGLTLAQKI
jgi:predicted O-methyltransferase YrrM